MVCVACGKNVKPNFNYFCRGCYHNLKRKLGVSRSDFGKYLRYGLGVHIHIPEDWNFKQMYDSLLETHPTLFSLANLIEHALFLKVVFHRDFDLSLAIVMHLMITLPPQITESFVPITAGIIVSLINKYIINSACCEAYSPQEVD